MSYYTALINAWNSTTQPPTGVTGTGLLSTDTQAQAITKVNAWTVAGPAVACSITPSQIINCIDTVAHLNALTATQLMIMQFLAGSGQPIFAPPGSTIRQWFQSTFAGEAATLSAFAALVAQFDSPPVPWWSAANGGALSGVVTAADLAVAGLGTPG